MSSSKPGFPEIANHKKACSYICDFLAHFTNEVRLRILCRLAQGEATVNDLAESVECRQSTVSQHLRSLRLGGIVAREIDGNRRVYRISDPGALELMGTLAEIAARIAGEAEDPS